MHLLQFIDGIERAVRLNDGQKDLRRRFAHLFAEQGFRPDRRSWHANDIRDRSDRESQERAVVTLARGLDMSVTAEGVETRERLKGLKTLGVNFAQGYLLGRPVPVAELEGQPQSVRSRLDAT